MGTLKLNNFALWPLADDEERNNGWTLSCRFLRAVKLSAQAHNTDVSMEATEAVLLAAQAHALLSSNAYREHTD
jgi:hypothetical protein